MSNTDTDLLIRVSPDDSPEPGMELACMAKYERSEKPHGDFYYITGETAGELGSGGERLEYFIPAGVSVLGLYFTKKSGWILREEDHDSREPLGRAWLNGRVPPENEIKFSDA